MSGCNQICRCYNCGENREAINKGLIGELQLMNDYFFYILQEKRLIIFKNSILIHTKNNLNQKQKYIYVVKLMLKSHNSIPYEHKKTR